MRRKLAAGNWKMNGTIGALTEVNALIARVTEVAKGGALKVGGQDCHAEVSGAHTGDISAAMLADAGASHVILGHSERRADHGETDSAVRAKAEAAQASGLVALI